MQLCGCRDGPLDFRQEGDAAAGVADRVDLDEEKVFVHRSKDEIKNAPEFEEDSYLEPGYRGRLSGYYGPGGTGFRDW